MIEHLGLTHLLPGVTFAAEFSPFLVNDIVCLVMALAMNICRGMTVRPRHYLLNLATASNAGSTATITGRLRDFALDIVGNVLLSCC